ncbi:MAG: hypothetical protein ORN51_02885, partial [Akkermansiaceae bacterium]|nr:hypothetical protein [Akkermansiaceae bacterium]
MKSLLILISTIALTGSIYGYGEKEMYNSTSALKESWDPNAVKPGTGAFVWKATDGNRYRRSKPADTDKKPEDIPTTDRTTVDTQDLRNFKFETTTASLTILAAETPAAFLTRLDSASADEIKNLNPKGIELRDIIQKGLYQSWEYMTHNLNAGADDGNRKNLLRKIWEYRQWHHDYLLNQTQAVLGLNTVVGNYDSGYQRLTEWAAAGSTTLTSDIDVNLKGTDTEAAAKKFNELFKADGWLYECGVVYDVNVYAIDFMYKEGVFGSGMVLTANSGGLSTTT